MAELTTIRIPTEPFTQKSFAPFGTILEAPARTPDFKGSRSESWATPFDAGGPAKIMYSRFHHQPMRFSVLERHFTVTQGFVPLFATPLVMVVAPPTGRDTVPAPDSLRAFLMDGTLGLLIHAGVWHTLDRFPVEPPHVDVIFLNARDTQDELIREKADGTPPVLTELVDYSKKMDIEFEVVVGDRLRG